MTVSFVTGHGRPGRLAFQHSADFVVCSTMGSKEYFLCTSRDPKSTSVACDLMLEPASATSSTFSLMTILMIFIIICGCGMWVSTLNFALSQWPEEMSLTGRRWRASRGALWNWVEI